MDVILEGFRTFWSELVDRPEGPMAFRFILQPCMSLLMALRDGIKDAKTGRTPYLWHISHTDSRNRNAALAQGMKATGRIMFLGIAIDVAYQFKVMGGFVRPVEAIVIALVLGFLPYLVMRGPVSRIAKWLISRR